MVSRGGGFTVLPDVSDFSKASTTLLGFCPVRLSPSEMRPLGVSCLLRVIDVFDRRDAADFPPFCTLDAGSLACVELEKDRFVFAAMAPISAASWTTITSWYHCEVSGVFNHTQQVWNRTTVLDSIRKRPRLPKKRVAATYLPSEATGDRRSRTADFLDPPGSEVRTDSLGTTATSCTFCILTGSGSRLVESMLLLTFNFTPSRRDTVSADGAGVTSFAPRAKSVRILR
eukprot:scaffold7340_cov266-Pinguiococcus_pyrenoidosus.AAC.59